MPLQYTDEGLIENTDGSDYRVSRRFTVVLDTLPDTSVPEALVLIGILTGELTSVTGETSCHQEIAAWVSDPPAAAVPPDTVERILWLLNEVRESIDDDRKQKIGRVLSNSGLNSPATVTTDSPKTGESGEGNELSHSGITTTDSSRTGGNRDTRNQSETDFECEFCDERFRAQEELMSHLPTCSERPNDVRFSCPHCDRTYHSQFAVDRHVERSHEPTQETVYRCSECGDSFESAMELLKHKPSQTEQSSTDSGIEDVPPPESEQDPSGELIVKEDIGVITHYNAEDRYGFISTSEVSDDVFFHVSETTGYSPMEDDLVQYDIRVTDRGYKAVNISYQPRKQPPDDPFASTRARWGGQ